jgi:hypothetical protein
MSMLGPDFKLVLQDVTFDGMEIPGSINFGGRQILGVHQLPGGTRIIDVMSRDDADIMWEGIFLGTNATQRARQLDFYRQTGQQVTLLYNTFQYLCIVEEFHADFERYYQVPYRITLKVVVDLSAPPQLAAQSSIFDLLTSDLASVLETGIALGMGIASALPSPVSSAAGISLSSTAISAPPAGDALDLTQLAADLTTVESDIATVTTSANVTAATVAQLEADLTASENECAALLLQSEAALDSASAPGGVISGQPDPAAFLSYMDICNQAAEIVAMNSLLTRMNKNAASGALP